MRDLDLQRRTAGGAGPSVGTYATRLLDTHLLWTRMRQVYRLLGLARRFGAERVDHAAPAPLAAGRARRAAATLARRGPMEAFTSFGPIRPRPSQRPASSRPPATVVLFPWLKEPVPVHRWMAARFRPGSNPPRQSLPERASASTRAHPAPLLRP